MQAGPDPADPAQEHSDSAPRDTLATGPGRSWWRERWRASSTPARALSVTALGLALAAVVVADVALHTQPVRHVRTVFEAAKPGPVTVDSSGCPARERCTVIFQINAKVGLAVLRAFPGAEITSSVLVRNAASGRAYERVVTARSGRLTLNLTSQCIPGAEAGPSRVYRAPVIRTGSSVVRHVEVIDGGRNGCSVSVATDVYGSSTKPDRAILALAHDPALQLTP